MKSSASSWWKFLLTGAVFAVMSGNELSAARILAADTVADSTVPGVFTNTLGANRPRRLGEYTLAASATNSLEKPPHEIPDPKIEKYPGGEGKDRLDDAANGVAYKPTARANIDFTKTKWDSTGSFAKLNPTGTKPDKTERAEALATVEDPYFFDPLPLDEVATLEFILTAGALGARASGPDEIISASYDMRPRRGPI